MTIELDIADRIILKNLLIAEGTIEEVSAALDVYNKIKLTEEERAALKPFEVKTLSREDLEETGLAPLAAKFTLSEVERVKSVFNELSEKRKMNMEFLTTYRKFDL